MLTPGMLDILTTFVAEYSPAECQADILEALSAIPPLPALQEWLVTLELTCRLDGLHHRNTAGQLAGYLEALRLATLEQSPYVCVAHLELALSELEAYRLLTQGIRRCGTTHGASARYRFN
jgi:hypothetical protein